MADPENQQPVDTTQQVTTPADTTSPVSTTRDKNPKRVAAGKAIAEKTRQAREQQKKALAEAQLLIANYKIQKNDEPPAAVPAASESTINDLTTTQWLSVISIVVSLWGIYNKREEIKALFAKLRPVDVAPPQPVASQPVAPQPVASQPVASQKNHLGMD